MSEHEMTSRLLLPRHRVRKLRALQRAVALFDRVATLPRQVGDAHHVCGDLLLLRLGSFMAPCALLTHTAYSALPDLQRLTTGTLALNILSITAAVTGPRLVPSIQGPPI